MAKNKTDQPEENKKEIQESIKKFPEETIEPKKEKKERAFNKLNQAVEFLQTLYQFRFNEITTELEYKLKAEKEFRFLDEFGYNEIFYRLNEAGINIAENLLRSILFSVHCEDYIGEKYNPFK